MKNTFVLFLCFLFFAPHAQNNSWCGTVAPPAFLKEYAAKNRTNYNALLSQRAGINWVPICYHIITQNDGTGGVSLKDVFDSHCALNAAYNPFGIGFYINGIDTIADTQLWNYNNTDPATVFIQHNIPRTCNIYIDGNLPGLCGFGTFPSTYPNGGGIFLNKECVGAGTTTLPHEMGHFFGLLHTFDSSFGVEFVNGTNCSSAGDLFCDTPADFLDSRTPCPYTGDKTDPNGDLYRTVIDPTLYMSYFDDNCVNRFSNMEEAEMVNTLTTNGERSALLNQPLPDFSAPDSVKFISPVNGDNSVNSQKPVFRWNSVPGAAYYYFHLQSATSIVVFADTVITDTFFVAVNLQPIKKYKFIAKAISLGNTCQVNGNFQFIQASNIAATFIVNKPSCNNQTNGSIVTLPAGGTPPYSFYWNNGSTDSILTNVTEGNYAVTVTDNNGGVVSSYVFVGAPVPVAVQFDATNGNIVATGEGGTPPYNYHWSNGVTSGLNTKPGFGDYQITVTDAKGCSATQNFVFTAVTPALDMQVSMKVFPNPSTGVETVNVQVELDKNTEGTILLLNMNGELLYQHKRLFNPGINQANIPVAQLPAGIYLLRFLSNNAMITERLAIVR